MSKWTRNRPPTPPPLVLQYQDDDPSADPHSWYWEPHAGGMVLKSGKHSGQKINELSLNYLLWCRENQATHPAWQKFNEAFDYYYTGLEDMVKDEYANFIVPFGKKHRGKTIRQCRDKDWFLWLRRQRNLTGNPKFRLFFAAVREWLAQPRHQEVARDIGEALTTTEYGDDLDLALQDVDSYEEPTSEDYAFIDDSGVSQSSATCESDGTSSGADEQSPPIIIFDDDTIDLRSATDSGADEQSPPIVISDDEIDLRSATGGEGGAEEESEVDGTQNSVNQSDAEDDGQNESPSDSEPEVKSYKHSTENFVVDDASTDDNGSYSDSSTQVETPVPSARLTRSQTKARRQGVAPQLQASSPIQRRRGRRVIQSEPDSSSENNDEPLATFPSISRSRARKIIHSESESGGSSEHEDAPLKASSPVSRARDRKIIHSEPESGGSSEPTQRPSTTSFSISRSRDRKIILSGTGSGVSSTNDDESLPTLAAILEQASGVSRGGRGKVPSEDDSNDEEHRLATPPHVSNFTDPASCFSHRSEPTAESPPHGSRRVTRPNTKRQEVVCGPSTEPSCSTRRPDAVTSETDEEPLGMPSSVTHVQTSAALYSHHSQTKRRLLVRRMKSKEKQKTLETDAKGPPQRASRTRQSKSSASADENPQNAIDSRLRSPSVTPSEKPLTDGEAPQSRRRKRDKLTRSPKSSEEEAPLRKRRRQ